MVARFAGAIRTLTPCGSGYSYRSTRCREREARAAAVVEVGKKFFRALAVGLIVLGLAGCCVIVQAGRKHWFPNRRWQRKRYQI
jgi:hypothetical protein